MWMLYGFGEPSEYTPSYVVVRLRLGNRGVNSEDLDASTGAVAFGPLIAQ